LISSKFSSVGRNIALYIKIGVDIMYMYTQNRNFNPMYIGLEFKLHHFLILKWNFSHEKKKKLMGVVNIRETIKGSGMKWMSCLRTSETIIYRAEVKWWVRLILISTVINKFGFNNINCWFFFVDQNIN
jgi:hypothetical protein